ncbi:MAG: DUF308 domain-containing protein [Cryomorphaceae bacterium]|jgi:hypothetical protein|nr:DUF308 domain-containing protein [Cryomorphaceae bacterium]
MKNITIILLGFLLFLGSCTIQKRVYRPGFTVEWKGDKFQKSNEKEALADKVVENGNVATNLAIRTNTDADQNLATVQIINSTANTDYEGLQAEDYLNSTSKTGEVAVEKQSKIVSAHAEKAPTYNMKKAAKYSKGATLEHKASIAADDEGNGALKGIGWVFIIIGILILVFASILVGILLMLVGLLFFVVGKNN